MRTLEDLNIGKYTIEYVPGETNIVADDLFRVVTFADCVDKTDSTYRVDETTDYVTIEGGPNSMFKSLAYALHGTIDDHITIRGRVIERLLKPEEFKLINNRETRRALQAMKNENYLPCFQALLTFAVEYSANVIVYQMG